MKTYLRRKVAIEFSMTAQTKLDRARFRSHHRTKNDILVMEEPWIGFIRHVWDCIRQSLRRRYPSPGKGLQYAILLEQFRILLQLDWREAKSLVTYASVTTKSTGIGKRDTMYIMLNQHPHIANYIVDMYDDGQLLGTDWDHIYIEDTNRTDQPFKQVKLKKAVSKLRKSIKSQSAQFQ